MAFPAAGGTIWSVRSPIDLRPPPLPAPSAAPAPAASGRRDARRWRRAALAVVLAAVATGAGLWWFVLRHHAPAPVTLDQAVTGVPGATAPGAAGAATGLDGTWSVDRTIINAQGTGSYAGFRVNEVLAGLGSNTAVGRTSTVDGTLTVQGTTLEAARITAKLTDVTSDDSRRDGAIQRALDTSRFPTATFVLTRPVEVGALPAEGQRITTTATGDLTVHGVSREVTVDLQAQLQNGVLVVVGSTDISFVDYGVIAPSAPVVASVDDHATLEIQLYFTRD